MGELTKLQIEIYRDQYFNDSVIEYFELPINPEQLSQSFKLAYDVPKTAGAQGAAPKFKYTHPEEIKLDFVFDGTGIIPIKGKGDSFYKNNNPSNPENEDFGVRSQVETFLSAVYFMDGETHKPNYLRLLWGNISFGNKKCFDCILKDLKITYTLFSADGRPLRAKLSATFVSYVAQLRRVREENKKSPDVTHLRKVKADDRLPLMAHHIYGDSDYYLQVARVNGLVNFRRLRTNTDLLFPPIEKAER